MIKVAFLGFGNVNSHLCKALHQSTGVSVVQIYNRSNIELNSEFSDIDFTTKLEEIGTADVYIIGIPDDAITTFSEQLPLHDQLVVHTSGGANINVLSNNNRKGIFYPLQTFSKNREVDFKDIPICIESENASDLELLTVLGSKISKKVVEVSSEERAKLHVAAVFVNNFVNYLYSASEEILKNENLDFDLLKPLIAETASKIETLSPLDVQTGPAKRNDKTTIEKHLHLLEDSPYKNLYQQLTRAIQEKYKDGKKL